MANIRVDITYTIFDGAEVVFRAPCDCSDITGLKIHYPDTDGNAATQIFQLADAHRNNIGTLNELFVGGAIVKVIIDTDSLMAYVQNADTNAYLEGKFKEKLPLSGGTLTGPLTLAGDPTNDLHAVTKHYVDTHTVKELNPDNLTKPVPIAKGGTGATTAANALTNLGAVPTTRKINGQSLDKDINIELTASSVGAVPVERTINNYPLNVNINLTAKDVGALPDNTPVPITKGGTGATTAAKARTNLGVPSTTEMNNAISSHVHSASNITGGTFGGQVVAHKNSQTPSMYLIRNQKLSATEEIPTVEGEICWVYR